jgi:hypothetical protein
VDVAPADVAARRFYGGHGGVDMNPHWLVWQDISVVVQKAP